MRIHRGFYTVITGIFCLLFIMTSSVQAQVVEQEGIRMVCLKALQGECFKSNGNNCSSGPLGAHTTEVQGGGFEFSKPIEIWRKINNTNEQTNTTQGTMSCAADVNGIPTSDNPSCAVSPKEDFQVLTAAKNELTADLNGQLVKDINPEPQAVTDGGAVILKSETEENKIHTFYGIQVVDGGDVLKVEETALKLSTFFPPTDGLSTCVTVKWDPFGTVFDAISLEPIASSSVTLYRNSISAANKVATGPGVETNPFIVSADGVFSFIVEDGNYVLEPKKTNYTFPISANLLETLKTSETFKYLYPNQNVVDTNGNLLDPADANWVYNSEIIRQAGYIKHRDIPLLPKDANNPTNVAPVITDLDITLYCVGDSCYQIVRGSCSHPRCTATIAQGGKVLLDPTNEKPYKIEVDAQRQFELVVANDAIPDQSRDIEIILEKYSPSAQLSPTLSPSPSVLLQKIKRSIQQIANNYIPSVYSASTTTSTFKISPIPARIIGYAYDKKLQTVPSARVRLVIPEMNNRTVITVQADKNGFVEVPQYLIPPARYEVQILDQNNKVVNQMPTSRFIALNKPFLTKNNVNLLTIPKPNEKAILASAAAEGNGNITTGIPFGGAGVGIDGSLGGVSPTPPTASATKQSSPLTFILVSIFFIFVLAGLGIMVLRMRAVKPL